ncbi:endonuclease/exonuclease/phosphatase family protein [mine drainage metagenome]|uniref:Endonuclease/exonuclease/phosphatase family protein n=1 Tax=mine drainage metagenome TaxID=410659 RepID=A0A1J5RNT9_9ZZZZ
MPPLRLATFNLENLDDRAADGFGDRLDLLRPQLRRLRADVLCLQEVNAREEARHGPRRLSALDRLLDGTGYEACHRVVSLNRKGKRFADHHNLVILSRLPILEQRQIWHDLVPAQRYRPVTGTARDMVVEWDRPLLLARLDLGAEQTLWVMNLHLRAPRAAYIAGDKEHGVWSSAGGWAEGFALAAMKAAGQALEARLAIDALFAAEPHALLAACGDLNADDHETPVRLLCADQEDTGNGHLAAQTLVPVDRALPPARRHSVIHAGRPVMLDHILVSRPLLGHYAAGELHNETLGDELLSPALVRGAPDSMHAPLVAEFLFP